MTDEPLLATCWTTAGDAAAATCSTRPSRSARTTSRSAPTSAAARGTTTAGSPSSRRSPRTPPTPAPESASNSYPGPTSEPSTTGSGSSKPPTVSPVASSSTSGTPNGRTPRPPTSPPSRCGTSSASNSTTPTPNRSARSSKTPSTADGCAAKAHSTYPASSTRYIPPVGAVRGASRSSPSNTDTPRYAKASRPPTRRHEHNSHATPPTDTAYRLSKARTRASAAGRTLLLDDRASRPASASHDWLCPSCTSSGDTTEKDHGARHLRTGRTVTDRCRRI